MARRIAGILVVIRSTVPASNPPTYQVIKPYNSINAGGLRTLIHAGKSIQL